MSVMVVATTLGLSDWRTDLVGGCQSSDTEGDRARLPDWPTNGKETRR